MEKKLYILSDYYKGNWLDFNTVASNIDTAIVYDIDGVLCNSPEVVFSNFRARHQSRKIEVYPHQIDRWDFLSYVAKENNLDEVTVKEAENDWYLTEVLEAANPYSSMPQLVALTLNFYGSPNNYVLTSRKPNLAEGTLKWMSTHYPHIATENIFIRPDELEKETVFKARNINEIAVNHPYVLFIDDSTKYVKHVLDNCRENVHVIHTPLGLTQTEFTGDRLHIVKRCPHELQSMYPLMDAFQRVISLD